MAFTVCGAQQINAFCLKEQVSEVQHIHSIYSLCCYGLLGIFHGNPSGEKRFLLAYFILFLIGAGSAGLHGTLHWFFQSSDELPMLYLINSLNYIIEEYNAPMGKPKRPHLASLLVGISVLNTLVYYRYQDMYIIFLVTFSLSNARLDYICLSSNSHLGP